ncbi:hypothetical protein BO219_01140 [Anoxybacillus kestanbolensis]|uniref:Uncharacterized protein n=1 Tax=Anoxybacillus kestanbolensis TaxID=227476 RepID=A0A1V3FXL6_9BACL|nr:hypothetical protein BO219_01140 [Anoxybacillus kestanbolensis]
MNLNNAEKGKKKLLTKNEIIYIIPANSTKVRVVFGNNGPENEKMKVPLVAYGFALIERDARFHNRLKIVWGSPPCGFDSHHRHRK